MDTGVIRLISGDAERRLPLDTLVRATVLHRDVYAADAIVLRLTFSGAEQVEMFRDDPQWERRIAELDGSGRIAVPSAFGQVQMIAGGADDPPRELIPR